jgi:hypothetical protein
MAVDVDRAIKNKAKKEALLMTGVETEGTTDVRLKGDKKEKRKRDKAALKAALNDGAQKYNKFLLI